MKHFEELDKAGWQKPPSARNKLGETPFSGPAKDPGVVLPKPSKEYEGSLEKGHPEF